MSFGQELRHKLKSIYGSEMRNICSVISHNSIVSIAVHNITTHIHRKALALSVSAYLPVLPSVCMSSDLCDTETTISIATETKKKSL